MKKHLLLTAALGALAFSARPAAAQTGSGQTSSTIPLSQRLGNGLNYNSTTGLYSVAPATSTTIGGVKPGTGLAVLPDGTLNVTAGGTNYTLPNATSTTLGGVICGTGTTCTNGVLTVAQGSSLQIGTTTGTAADGGVVATQGSTISTLTSNYGTLNTQVGTNTTAIGTANTNITALQALGGRYQGTYASGTAYKQGDLVMQGSQLLAANAAFTSGTFNAANWTTIANLLTLGTTTGTAADGGVVAGQGAQIASNTTAIAAVPRYRGTFAASFAYNAGDTITQAGQLYSANAAFTSGSTFSATNWTVAGVAIGATTGTAGDGGVLTTTTATANAAAPKRAVITQNCATSQTLAPGTAYNTTLTGNCAFSFASATGGAGFEQNITLEVQQDSTAGRTPTLPTGVKWAGGTAPTPNTTAGKIDFFTFRTLDGGTTWFGGY